MDIDNWQLRGKSRCIYSSKLGTVSGSYMLAALISRYQPVFPKEKKDVKWDE